MKHSVLTLPALLAVATLAFAQNGPPPEGGPPGGRPRGPSIEMLTKDLSLTAAQATQVKSILEAQRAKMEAQRAQNPSGERPSREAMQARRQANDAELHQQLSSVLSAEQLQKFDAMRQRGPMGGPPQ